MVKMKPKVKNIRKKSKAAFLNAYKLTSIIDEKLSNETHWKVCGPCPLVQPRILKNQKGAKKELLHRSGTDEIKNGMTEPPERSELPKRVVRRVQIAFVEILLEGNRLITTSCGRKVYYLRPFD